ncbi:retrovirus-related Pol polyprotein from transposon TNT 1-94 [Trifolium pratense]|uniref:Retrovirus-related Pol polyprotein from transposon TNT 1-94 n=1 Tax=Trifolium pratense TaxID=57577 RepID=A0A2K3MJQ0_TRIPR|nr:retrovirus-related Pol polyprotein from transposon TNT 1-94 [Trifolium pratense]
MESTSQWRHHCTQPRYVVNPEIPLQYASVTDRLDGKNFDEYQKWLFKYQTLFTWLLSTFSDGVLPCVLSCKHSHEVWDKIHKYFNSVFKSRAQMETKHNNTNSDTEVQDSGTEHYNVNAYRGRGRGKGRARGRGRAQYAPNTW